MAVAPGAERRHEFAVMTSSLYAQGRRALVIHEDDVGMTHGSNVAFQELSARGVVSSGSAMAPCPWFPETLALAAADPTLDLGVHLTLNAEKQPYKWRPLTRPPASAGLTDEFGYLWEDVRRSATRPRPRRSRRSCAPRSTPRSPAASMSPTSMRTAAR